MNACLSGQMFKLQIDKNANLTIPEAEIQITCKATNC
jgi:hypothetical protein